MSDSPTPGVPNDAPAPSAPAHRTVGQHVDKALAEGQRVASTAAERARVVAGKAAPHVRRTVASANGALNKLSANRPWIKPAIIGAGAFLIALVVWTAIAAMFRSGDGSPAGSGPATGASASQPKAASGSSARQEFIKKAGNMGQIDAVLAQRAIEMVEQQGLHRSAGWQVIDEMMYQATRETQVAYRAWRKSVQSQ